MFLSKVVTKVVLEIVKLIYPPERQKVVQTRIHGLDILVLANEDVGRRISVFHSYEERESDLLKSIIKDDDVCVDAGANVGFYSLLMAKAASHGTVHSFEPIPLNWHLLNASVHLNGFKNVFLNNQALGKERGESSFSSSVDGAYSSMIDVGRKKEADKIRVSVETIDEYMFKHSIEKVDIMKIDVEGAEALVLNGAQRLFLSDAKPRLVLLELFDENFKFYDTSISEISAILEGYGYFGYVILNDRTIEMFEEKHHNEYYNVFYVLNDAILKMPYT